MDYIKLLREANKVAIESKEKGNHPFGAVLVDEKGEILLRQGNLEVTENISIGHAETMLMEAAGKKYSKEGIRVVRGDNVTIGNLRWDTEKDKRWNEPFDKTEYYSLQANDIVQDQDIDDLESFDEWISKWDEDDEDLE